MRRHQHFVFFVDQDRSRRDQEPAPKAGRPPPGAYSPPQFLIKMYTWLQCTSSSLPSSPWSFPQPRSASGTLGLTRSLTRNPIGAATNSAWPCYLWWCASRLRRGAERAPPRRHPGEAPGRECRWREERHLLLAVALRLQDRPHLGELGIALGALAVVSCREVRTRTPPQVPLDLLHNLLCGPQERASGGKFAR